MANEDQYYNPIIKAMVANAQSIEAKEKLKNDQALAKQHIASQKIQDTQKERELDLHQKHLDFEREHGMSLLESQKAMTAAQIDALHATNLLTKQKASLSGVDIGAALGQDQAKGIPTTSDALQAEINRIRGTSQAKAEGELPSQEALLAQHGEQNEHLGLQQHAQKLIEMGKQGDLNERIANIHGHYQQSTASINGVNHLRGIALMHSLGMDDGSGSGATQAKNLMEGVYNGNIDYKGMRPDEKKAVDAYASANGELKGLPTDTKKYGAALDNLGKMQTFVDQFRDLATNYSRDSPGAYGKGSQNLNLPIIGTLHRTEPGSDLDSRINSLKTIGGALSKYFEGQSRSAEADILRQATGAFDPKATKEQNLKKLENHVQQLQSVVKNTFTGMTPDRINKILGDRGITDFGAFKPTIAVAPNGHQIISHDGGKTWLDNITHQPFVPKSQ